MWRPRSGERWGIRITLWGYELHITFGRDCEEEAADAVPAQRIGFRGNS